MQNRPEAGRRVVYIPPHADGKDHRDAERGVVSSHQNIREGFVFVKYDLYQNSPYADTVRLEDPDAPYTAQLTQITDLEYEKEELLEDSPQGQ